MVSNHPFANKINPKTVDRAGNQKKTEKSSERGLSNRWMQCETTSRQNTLGGEIDLTKEAAFS